MHVLAVVLLAGALPELLPAALAAQAIEPPRPLTSAEYDALVRGEQEPTYASIPFLMFGLLAGARR